MDKLTFIFLMGFTALFFASNSHAVDSIPAVISTDINDMTGQCALQTKGSFVAIKNNVTLAECWPLVESWAQSTGFYSLYKLGFDYYTGSLWSGYRYGSGTYYSSHFRYLTAGYTCDNPDYPTLNGSVCEVFVFVLDQDIVDAFNAKAEEMKDSAIIKDASIDELEQDLVNAADDIEQLDSDLTLSASEYSAINAQTDVVELLTNSDATLQTSLDSMNSLLDSAFEDATSINANLTESVEEFEDGHAIYDENEILIGRVYDNIAEYNDGTRDYEYSETQSDADNTIVSLDLLEDEINNDLDQIQSNNDSISDSVTSIDNSISNSQTLIENVHEYYSESTTIYNGATGEGIGDVCTGDNCATESEEVESYASATYEYEQIYPDGIAGVMTDRVAEFKSGAFYGSLQNFIITLSGVTPVIEINTVTYGTYILDIPSYVWDLIKAILILSTTFLCRRIIFGG